MMKAIIFVFLALASVVSAGDQVFPKSSCYGAPSSQANNVNLSAPVFVGAPASYLSSSHLVLNFNVDARFSTIAFAFTTGSQGTTGTGSSCDFSINEAGVQTPTTNSWTSTDLATTPTCTDAVRFTADFTSPQTALGQCFTYDNTTDGNFVYYTAVVKITTTQKRAPIRNTPITRTVTTAVQLRFRFQRFITVNASAINVVGRANVLADIITQSFDTTTQQTTIELYTSVQQPYALTLTGADASDVTNVGTDATYNYVKVSGPTLYFAGNNGVGGASTNDLTCTAAGVNILTALTSGPTGSSSPTACVQKWRIVIAETTGKCAYVGARVTYNFKLTTAPDYVGSSSGITTIAGSSSFQFQYDLTTNDYCAKIVDDITLDGTLTPYGALATDPTNPGTPLYNYLFGQYVYFLAHVTASAGPSITGTNLDSATVTTISTINTKIVPFTANSADNVFGFTKGNFLSVSQPQYAYFRFLVDENTVALDDYDVAQPVSVSAVFRVDYQNLGNAGSSAVELSNNRFTTYAAGNQGLTMQVDVGVTRPSTATGSSSLVAMVAGIAAGCVALTAFVALFLYRRSTKKFAEEMSAPVDPKELEALEGRLATTAV